MQVMYEHCAGLDVHKKTVVVCVATPTGQETRTFSTMTARLAASGRRLVGGSTIRPAAMVPRSAADSTGRRRGRSTGSLATF
jgi:hypothetical protein